MKKIFSITMAAVCAFTVSAFGFSACGGEDAASDEVTEEQWAAAMEESKFYNVTGECSGSYLVNITGSDGSEESASDVMSGEVKLDLTAAAADYVTGNTYMYYSESESRTSTVDADGNYSTSGTVTEYEVFTDEFYSFVSKENYSDQSEDWDGNRVENNMFIFNLSNAYGTVKTVTYFMSLLGVEYSDFTYSDGAYRYSISEGGDTYTVAIKINDGFLSYFAIETSYEEMRSSSSYAYTEDGILIENVIIYTEVETMKYEYNFSNYGTTSVTVPAEYTYEYYLANYAD